MKDNKAVAKWNASSNETRKLIWYTFLNKILEVT